MKRGVLLVLALLLLLVPSVLGHVGYVLDEKELEAKVGADTRFLLSALTLDNALIALNVLALVVLLFIYLPKNQRFFHELNVIHEKVALYDMYLPWIARLGLGIALIGAGTAGVLFSPGVPFAGVATFQILLGFLLLAGLFSGLCAWLALSLYVLGLFHNRYLLGNLDMAGLAFAIIFLGTERPGIGDIFGIPFFAGLSRFRKYVPTVARISIGLAMLYLAFVEKLLNPHWSELVVTQYELTSIVPVSAAMWVLSVGLVEAFVGLFLLIGWRTRLVSAIAFSVLSLSFFFFKEDVYSHITLFAILSILFVTGSGRFSLDEWLSQRGK